MKYDLTDLCFFLWGFVFTCACPYTVNTTFSYSLGNVNMSCTFETVPVFSCVSLCVVNKTQTSDIKLTVKSKKSGKVSLLSSSASQTPAVSCSSILLKHLCSGVKMQKQEKLQASDSRQGKQTLWKKLALRSRISAPEVSIPTRINTNTTWSMFF